MIASLSLALGTLTQASVVVTQNIDADDVTWTRAGFTDPDPLDPLVEKYDQRSLSISGAKDLVLQSVRIILDTSGVFDDSLSVDIDADGTIDFIASQEDAYNNPATGVGVYTPWVSALPFTLEALITLTGTTITAYWNGIEIDAGVVSGLDDVANYTLEDWGNGSISGDGTITDDVFLSEAIRVGNLNEAGPSAHDMSFSIDALVLKDDTGEEYVFDPDNDGIPSSVPEPSSSSLLLISGALACFRRKRHSA